MTLGDIAIYARNLVNADSVSWTDANLLIGINMAYQKVVSMILESQDESDFDDAHITATYPIYQRTLAARKDYAFSTVAWQAVGKEGASLGTAAAILPLKIKRLDISYDGVNFYKAEPIDDGQISSGLGNDTVTDQSYIRQSPRFDVKSNAVFIYPTPTAADVTAGAVMRLEAYRNVIPFTSGDLSTGTTVPGFDEPFHPMLAYISSYDYAMSRQLPQLQQLQTSMQDWEIRLRQAYGRKELDRRAMLTPFYDSYFYR